MKATWKRIQTSRDRRAVPEYLVITVCGRQFCVELTAELRPHTAHLCPEVIVEIVGPTIGSHDDESPALRVFCVDEADRPDCLMPAPLPTAWGTLQLVAHDATSPLADEQVTLVRGMTTAAPEKGGRRG
jgi:hypothetical protein